MTTPELLGLPSFLARELTACSVRLPTGDWHGIPCGLVLPLPGIATWDSARGCWRPCRSARPASLIAAPVLSRWRCHWLATPDWTVYSEGGHPDPSLRVSPREACAVALGRAVSLWDALGDLSPAAAAAAAQHDHRRRIAGGGERRKVLSRLLRRVTDTPRTSAYQ